MELSKLLSAIRALYVVQFLKTLETMAQKGKLVVSEVALRDEHGEPERDGELQLPVRLDVVVLEGQSIGDSVSVDSAQRLNFARAGYLVGAPPG